MIHTTLRMEGKKLHSTITIGARTYSTSSNDGRVLEHAINNAHAVRGLHTDLVSVTEDIAGSRSTYAISQSKFLALLNGYGVRHSIVSLFQGRE